MVRILARWQLNDLLAGASDLGSYEVAKRFGWEFHIATNFHGKVFAFPPNGILVGSANATNAGLGLLSKSNSEVCTVVEENVENLELVNQLFISSVLVDDQLFGKLSAAYNATVDGQPRSDWPEEILKILTVPTKYDGSLFLSECLCSDGSEILITKKISTLAARSDASLLSIPDKSFDLDLIGKKLVRSKLYLWLKTLLDSDGSEAYFGRITSALHDSLMEDPAPYRSEIKNLVSNLYSWIGILGPSRTSMIVDTPNHSQRIRLI